MAVTISGSTPTFSSGYAGGTITSGTAVSASGTAINFTGIPSWAKRITVMFNGVSTGGTSHILVQIGSGSITSSGYNCVAEGSINGVSPAVYGSTAGFIVAFDTASDIRSGIMNINLINSNNYVQSHVMGGISARTVMVWGGGSVSLSGVLDTVRITTANGTDTFDAGTINIFYE